MYAIRDVHQIRMLASPLRLGIMDALETSDGKSAAELARILGCAPDALYHHLRLLTRNGLLISKQRANGIGRPYAVFALRGKPTRLRYRPSDRRNAAAVTTVVASMLRHASRTFARAMNQHPVVSGLRRNLWAGRCIAWLTPLEIEELNKLLHRITRLMWTGAPGRRRARLYALTFVLSPFGARRRSTKV